MSEPAQKESIWHGVYKTFDEAPKTDEVFNSSIWTQKQKERVLAALKDFRAGKDISSYAPYRDYPLADELSALLAKKDRVHMIDFGGSLGQTYLDVLSRIPGAEERLACTVVETEAVCQDVPIEIGEIKNLKFSSDINKIKDKIDLVHIGSTLQYIDDWRGLLRDITKKFVPQTIALSDLLVGDLPTFVTVQSFYGHKILARFTNMDEFMKFWEEMPYARTHFSEYYPLGKKGVYFANHALPPTHRLCNPCHMVFTRKK